MLYVTVISDGICLIYDKIEENFSLFAEAIEAENNFSLCRDASLFFTMIFSSLKSGNNRAFPMEVRIFSSWIFLFAIMEI